MVILAKKDPFSGQQGKLYTYKVLLSAFRGVIDYAEEECITLALTRTR